MHRGIRQGCPIQYNTMRFTTEIKKCGVDHFRIRHNTPTMTYNYIHIKKLHMCRMRKWSTPQKIIFLCENNYISIFKCCVNTRLIHNYFHIKHYILRSGPFPHPTQHSKKQVAPFSRLLRHARGCQGPILVNPGPHGGVARKKFRIRPNTPRIIYN